MSRYIDADKLIRKYIDTDIEKFSNSDVKIVLENLKQNILKAPSIDIVRCGECRRVREDGGHANCNGYLYCRKWKTLVDEDGYCSWGEREGE